MPKNIVLLSDGTGNSAAKLFKTNVWRTYEALDLTNPREQIAIYDDGVGTSSLRPLKVLGGVFGIGLKRNILHLYRFLCEHYEPGDRIYAFGFSRGAFTIRLLVGLIALEGIVWGVRDAAGNVRRAQGEDLDHLSRWAYREFRRRFNTTGGIVGPLRDLRDWWLKRADRRAGRPAFADAVIQHVREATPEDRRPFDQPADDKRGLIKFVGVWDTVAAYGMPIEEWTDGIDRWVWPLSMREQQLSTKVAKACHALALDDERNTFHPLLWDESTEPDPRPGEGRESLTLDDERISQVWFSGVHSNVGGGYPNDALAYVSYKWMTDEAALHGIRFVPVLRDTITARRDPLGRMYNPRAGPGGYYRYNPRSIDRLTDGQRRERALLARAWPSLEATVRVRLPKIHESVFHRIVAHPDGYAPIVFPKRYAVVTEDRRILDDGPDDTRLPARANHFDSPEVRGIRISAQQDAWDLVWWRRAVYFTTVFASLIALVGPLVAGVRAEHLPTGSHLLSNIVGAVSGYLPGFLSPWTEYYRVNPLHLVWFLVVLGALLFAGRRVSAGIEERMRRAWQEIFASEGDPVPSLNARDSRSLPTRWLTRAHERLVHDYTRRLRTSDAYVAFWTFMRRLAFPAVTGIVSLAVLVGGAIWLLTGVGTRTVFDIASVTGRVCTPGPVAAEPVRRDPAGRVVATIRPASVCEPTGVLLEEDATYRVHISLPGCAGNEWRDCSIPVLSPAGFNSRAPVAAGHAWTLRLGTPFRRIWGADWLTPVARIGTRGADHYVLDRPETIFTARRTGELFLFVNDAIAPIPGGWRRFYESNSGDPATVWIEKIAEPGEEPRGCPGEPTDGRCGG
jgi:hypothetical protein